MSSNLGRLFAYAREGAIEARENFTTEGLAAAIRDDPAPFVDTLRSSSALGWSEVVTEVAVSTQVPVPGTGFIDLAVLLSTADSRIDYWVEVKVWAGESGIQLTNYLRFLATIPELRRPRLISLSPHPLRSDDSVAWIPWMGLWRSIRSTPTNSPYWPDFKLYLEEIGMADEREMPVTALEALSLNAATRLVQKTQEILWLFSQQGRTRWPAYRWPITQKELLKGLYQQFSVHSRLMSYATTGTSAFPMVGVVDVDEEAYLIVVVESHPKRTDVRRQILHAADEGGLPSEWLRKLDGWWGLRRQRRLVSFANHSEAAAWLVESFAQLDRSDLLELFLTLGAAPPSETEMEATSELPG